MLFTYTSFWVATIIFTFATSVVTAISICSTLTSCKNKNTQFSRNGVNYACNYTHLLMCISIYYVVVFCSVLLLLLFLPYQSYTSLYLSHSYSIGHPQPFSTCTFQPQSPPTLASLTDSPSFTLAISNGRDLYPHSLLLTSHLEDSFTCLITSIC